MPVSHAGAFEKLEKSEGQAVLKCYISDWCASQWDYVQYLQYKYLYVYRLLPQLTKAPLCSKRGLLLCHVALPIFCKLSMQIARETHSHKAHVKIANGTLRRRRRNLSWPGWFSALTFDALVLCQYLVDSFHYAVSALVEAEKHICNWYSCRRLVIV
jgi:hypothetical protein